MRLLKCLSNVFVTKTVMLYRPLVEAGIGIVVGIVDGGARGSLVFGQSSVKVLSLRCQPKLNVYVILNAALKSLEYYVGSILVT